MKNLPEKIYLNFGDMTKDEFEKEDYNALTQQDEYAVTFSEYKVYDTDVIYIREDTVEDAKVNAMKDIAWKVHCMISEGKSIAEIDHYVCGVCDF